jgi:hypothetical protein
VETFLLKAARVDFTNKWQSTVEVGVPGDRTNCCKRKAGKGRARIREALCVTLA